MAENDSNNPSAGGTNRGSGAYGVLGGLSRILAPKVGPIPAALLLFGVIGAVAVIAATAVLRNPAVLLALLALLAVLASLTVVDQRLGTPRLVSPPRPPANGTDPIGRTAADWIMTAMTEFTESIAGELEMPADHVRSNLFQACPDGYMRMCPEVALRMTPQELTLRIPVGYGATGRTAQEMLPRVRIGNAQLDSTGNVLPGRREWGEAELEETEVDKPHKDLAWIMSAPIKQAGKAWVLNIDGIDPRPKSALEPLLRDVMVCASLIATTL